LAEKKMSVAMFGQKHMLSREGGVEIVVKELATRMSSRGYRVVVYDRKSNHVSGGKIELLNSYKGVRIIPVWTLEKKGLAAMTSSFFAAWRASKSSADIVHIHAEGPAAMCWLPKLKKKKVIVTIHGLDWQRAKWGGLATRYIKFGEKIAVKFADEIIVLSKGVQDYFDKQYGRKTVFIPNGVTKPNIIKADEIGKLWGLSKDSYVLFLGRIVPEKGLDYLIHAWKKVNTDKKLVIAGGSSDTQEYMDELKMEADDSVIFTGFQQGRVLEELFSNAYIYVLPSDLEGMPLSLLEAMSYGNCCLVSDIEECKEVVEDKAVAFSKGDTDDLKNSLQRLLDNPNIVARYKEGASEFICEKYNWDDVTERTLEIYGKER